MLYKFYILVIQYPKYFWTTLTLIPLGYFEDLSPFGGGGGILALPSDLGN